MKGSSWGVLAVLLLLAGCGAARIDGSTQESLKTSVTKVRDGVPEGERAAFDKALMAVSMNAVIGDGNLLAMAGKDPQAMAAEARSKLDGKTAADVLAMAEEIKAQRAEKERVQAFAEIQELIAKKASAEAAIAKLAGFKVSRSRFYKAEQRFGGPQPVIELAVTNGTDAAVSRAYFVGTVASPGRSVPWLKEQFNYDIPGGLELGESAEWSLSPNMFSDWGRVDAPADALFTVDVTKLDGADGKTLFDAAGLSNREVERLAELQKKYQ